VLSDGRVLLRAPATRDLPAIESGMHDPDVVRWIGPPEPSGREALRHNEKRWAEGSPTLAICEPDGACVGLVWMNLRELDPRTGFIGYWLLPEARGRGLATGAVRLLSAWVAEELKIEVVRLATAPDNERSQRVAERSGFRRVDPDAGIAPDGPYAGQVIFELEQPLNRRTRIG
jgi:RimJ/RimL family protein N-acetyltransferase